MTQRIKIGDTVKIDGKFGFGWTPTRKKIGQVIATDAIAWPTNRPDKVLVGFGDAGRFCYQPCNVFPLRKLECGLLADESGNVLCPKCGSGNLAHAYDQSFYGSLKLESEHYENGSHDVVVATDHMEFDQSIQNYRVFCMDCDFTQEDAGYDIP